MSLLNSATLTNEGTISAVGPLGDRRLSGSVTNDGTVSVNSATGGVHLDGSGLFVNHGSVSIADGTALTIPDGATYDFRNDSGGSVAGNGSGQCCSVGKVTRRHAARAKRGKVIAQSPAPGRHLPRLAKIKLTVGR